MEEKKRCIRGSLFRTRQKACSTQSEHFARLRSNLSPIVHDYRESVAGNDCIEIGATFHPRVLSGTFAERSKRVLAQLRSVLFQIAHDNRGVVHLQCKRIRDASEEGTRQKGCSPPNKLLTQLRSNLSQIVHDHRGNM